MQTKQAEMGAQTQSKDNTSTKPDNVGKEEDQKTPIDSIIERVDSYIKNPKLATPETLMDLKGELEDLKSFLDSDHMGEMGKPEESNSEEDGNGRNGKDGLAVVIGRMANGGRGGYNA